MTKLLSPARLILALAMVFTATGCELYFGGHDDRGSEPGEPGGPNYTCESNQDCAAGCFCSADGVCEEAGFCASDADCPHGFTCDETRSSCVPDAPPPTCTQTADCVVGTYCQDGACVPGTCAGPAATCNLQPPACAAGEVPLLDGTGCYTGTCFEIDLCSATPTCQALQHEADCLDNTACSSVYNGLNCTKADGSACHAGDTGCTCQNFVYASCTTRTTSRTVVETSTGFVDMSAYLAH